MWMTSCKTTHTLSQLNQVFHPWRQQPPVDPDPQPVIPPEISSHPPDDSAQLETTPASTSPMLRRPSRSHMYRPPQRLIKEM